jgi:anti-sigma-K factor RskA
MTATPRGSNPGDHEVLDELAVGWALHALEPEDEAQFAEHLAQCGRCARTVAETHDVMAAMATDLPPAEPSESLRSRLMAAVEATEQVVRPPAAPVEDTGPPTAPESPQVRPPEGSPPRRARHGARPSWTRVLPKVLVAAGVAAVVALGGWNVMLNADRNEAEQAVAEQQQMVQELLTPGAARIAPLTTPAGDTVATVVARDDRVQVVADGMMPNDDDHSYVLWGLKGDTPVGLGTFDVDSRGMAVRTIGSTETGLDDFSGYGITLEEGHQVPARPGTILAVG